MHENKLQTHNRTRNLEVTGCEDNAFALDAEAHTAEHRGLAVQGDHECTHDDDALLVCAQMAKTSIALPSR